MGVNFSEFFIHCIWATPSGGASRYSKGCATKSEMWSVFYLSWSWSIWTEINTKMKTIQWLHIQKCCMINQQVKHTNCLILPKSVENCQYSMLCNWVSNLLKQSKWKLLDALHETKVHLRDKLPQWHNPYLNHFEYTGFIWLS